MTTITSLAAAEYRNGSFLLWVRLPMGLFHCSVLTPRDRRRRHIFEYRVAAVVLTALLRGDRVEGLTVPVTAVRLQQSNFGYPLDDLVVRASSLDGRPLTVEFQIKRTIEPNRRDDEWRSFVHQCLQAVETDRGGLDDVVTNSAWRQEPLLCSWPNYES